MKNAIMMMSVLGVLSATSFAASADMLKLAEAKQCMSCHALDHEMPKAPSFKSIAMKYPDSAVDMLAGKVRSGGVGHWGAAPMPGAGARVEVSEEESIELVKWILSMRGEKKAY